MPTTQSPCPPCKVLINDGLVAEVAPLIDTPEARALAAAAILYRNSLTWLGIKVTREDLAAEFEGKGCEQAQKLYAWSEGEGTPDPELMRGWTAEFKAAYRELIHGNLP